MDEMNIKTVEGVESAKGFSQGNARCAGKGGQGCRRAFEVYGQDE